MNPSQSRHLAFLGRALMVVALMTAGKFCRADYTYEYCWVESWYETEEYCWEEGSSDGEGYYDDENDVYVLPPYTVTTHCETYYYYYETEYCETIEVYEPTDPTPPQGACVESEESCPAGRAGGGSCDWEGGLLCTGQGSCPLGTGAAPLVTAAHCDPAPCNLRYGEVWTSKCQVECKIIPFVSCNCQLSGSRNGNFHSYWTDLCN